MNTPQHVRRGLLPNEEALLENDNNKQWVDAIPTEEELNNQNHTGEGPYQQQNHNQQYQEQNYQPGENRNDMKMNMRGTPGPRYSSSLTGS